MKEVLQKKFLEEALTEEALKRRLTDEALKEGLQKKQVFCCSSIVSGI